MVIKTVIISLIVFCVSVIVSKTLTRLLFGMFKSSRYRVTRFTQAIIEIIIVFTISLLIGIKFLSLY